MSERAVVRIFATVQNPDYESPWNSAVPAATTGSGVFVPGNRILTGAHVVANATFIQVQKVSNPDKCIARVVSVCHDCDLALLEVQDPHFTDDVEHAELGGLPELRDRVQVVGYPVGGEEISVTEGVVSRIEVARYSHSQRNLLAVTVDAAINAGNSGGPVFHDGKMIGIAFQTLDGAENIGEMVPAVLIRNFLDCADTTEQVELPGLGITTQNLENPQLRRAFGLPEGTSGVLLTTVERGGSADGVLQHGDALISIAGRPIANNGTTDYRGRHRTRYDAVLSGHKIGDDLEVEVCRKGERLALTLTLRPLRRLVPRNRYDQNPRYLIHGGVVFQALTRNYLTTWDDWWNAAPKEFLTHFFLGKRQPDRTEVIILTHVLADEINVGYDFFHNETVGTVNGIAPRDFAHFASLIDAAEDVIQLRTSSDGIIVFDQTAALAANARILERYRIASGRQL